MSKWASGSKKIIIIIINKRNVNKSKTINIDKLTPIDDVFLQLSLDFPKRLGPRFLRAGQTLAAKRGEMGLNVSDYERSPKDAAKRCHALQIGVCSRADRITPERGV